MDAGDSRTSWIPTSHNIPVFADGISGQEILNRQRNHVSRYGGKFVSGTVKALDKADGGFTVGFEDGKETGIMRTLFARRVLLATGADDVEPDLPDLPRMRSGAGSCAIARSAMAMKPGCKRIAVLGHGDKGLSEAVFVARTYSHDVTLLTLGQGMDLDAGEHERVNKHGIKVVHEPVVSLGIENDRITVLRTAGGGEHHFEVLYSALGLKLRSELALALGGQARWHGCARRR